MDFKKLVQELSGYSMLVVGDEAIMKPYAELMSAIFYSVHIVENPLDAYEMLERGTYDIVMAHDTHSVLNSRFVSQITETNKNIFLVMLKEFISSIHDIEVNATIVPPINSLQLNTILKEFFHFKSNQISVKIETQG